MARSTSRSVKALHRQTYIRAVLPSLPGHAEEFANHCQLRQRASRRGASAHHVRPPTRTVVGRPLARTSVVWGKSVSVRGDLGGRRLIKKKIKHTTSRKQGIN